jgi:exosortase C (VPDSG-CTERM-specific)
MRHVVTTTTEVKRLVLLKRLIHGEHFRRTAGFILFILALVLIFLRPLLDLVTYAEQSELYSFILLVPLISLYLAKLRMREVLSNLGSSPQMGLIPLSIGILIISCYYTLARHLGRVNHNDYLSFTIYTFVALLTSGCFMFLGRKAVAVVAFPVAFLFLMAPLPSFLTAFASNCLQHASAAVAYLLLLFLGTPVLKDEQVFQLPGITIEVAPQCSGIHSSLVLFIISLVAGHLFLKGGWNKATLAFAVILIGILRNGARIVTICLLCVYVDPRMVDSPIHHHGGPLFLGLSLVPCFFLLLWLRRSEGSNENQDLVKTEM